jgi:hypothetical protein
MNTTRFRPVSEELFPSVALSCVGLEAAFRILRVVGQPTPTIYSLLIHESDWYSNLAQVKEYIDFTKWDIKFIDIQHTVGLPYGGWILSCETGLVWSFPL